MESRATDEEIWTVKAALDWTTGYLERKGDENPRLSAQWLIAAATGMTRIQIYADGQRPLSLDERAVLHDYVARRGRGEPLQYIIGETGFRHITVKVRPGVLIPRPETEVLVSEALALLPAPRKPQEAYEEALIAWAREQGEGDDGEHSEMDELSSTDAHAAAEPLLAADICTGSGCIACSLAFEHPDVHVVATDIAPEAVTLARENVANLEVGERVDVIECDLGAGIDPALMGSFDLVVSNPPYVPSAVMDTLPHEVAGFEPALALDGGIDGLAVYRRLLAWSEEALKPGGGLAVELHEECLDQAATEARAAGFSDVRITRDLAGRPRVLTARKANTV